MRVNCDQIKFFVVAENPKIGGRPRFLGRSKSGTMSATYHFFTSGKKRQSTNTNFIEETIEQATQQGFTKSEWKNRATEQIITRFSNPNYTSQPT